MLTVSCSKNPARYFAGRLYKSMKGAGTDDETLIRVMVSRCEVDMVQIKEAFMREYKKSLYTFIKVSYRWWIKDPSRPEGSLFYSSTVEPLIKDPSRPEGSLFYCSTVEPLIKDPPRPPEGPLFYSSSTVEPLIKDPAAWWSL